MMGQQLEDMLKMWFPSVLQEICFFFRSAMHFNVIESTPVGAEQKKLCELMN